MTDKAEQAASALLEARRTRTPIAALPEAARPASEDEAYAIQDRVGRALGAIRGWKTGAPGPAAPASFAPIFDVREGPVHLAGPEWRLFGIEGEIAFRIGRDLPARDRPYSQAEVTQAVGSVHPAIEVVESRYADFRAQDRLSLLADFTSNGALVIGPASGSPGFDMARPPARILFDGKPAAEGSGNSGGDPLRLLTELANHAARRTGKLAAGTVVTTGSTTGMIFAKRGTTVVADFAGWAKVELSFD
jgi:2-keto-4-pentenoate hydratase